MNSLVAGRTRTPRTQHPREALDRPLGARVLAQPLTRRQALSRRQDR